MAEEKEDNSSYSLLGKLGLYLDPRIPFFDSIVERWEVGVRTGDGVAVLVREQLAFMVKPSPVQNIPDVWRHSGVPHA